MAPILERPLASVGMRGTPQTRRVSSETSCSATRPVVLRIVQPAPDRDVPKYAYDPQRQIATNPAGDPLGPTLGKEWTSTEGTHTDGDGGDNESWSWEE